MQILYLELLENFLKIQKFLEIVLPVIIYPVAYYTQFSHWFEHGM